MRKLAALVLPLCMGFSSAGRAANSEGPRTFHIAMSASIFTGVNENDARAAMKAWAIGVIKQRKLDLGIEVLVYRNLSELTSALRSQQLDAFTISVAEYFSLESKIGPCTLFGAQYGPSIGETYVLLAHEGGAIQKLSDLRGRTLVLQGDVRGCLAIPWLDELGMQAAGRPLSQFCRKVDSSPKPGQVVLPVFFRQADACVVTQKVFATMSELNPQIGKSLRVLASSREFIPVILCVRHTLDPKRMEMVLDALRHLHESPEGRQSLNNFGTERMIELQPSDLNSTRMLFWNVRGSRAPEAPNGAGSDPAASVSQIGGGH